MGGGSYHIDVRSARHQVSSQRSFQETESAFAYSRQASAGQVSGAHSDVLVKGRVRECRDSSEHPNTTPIVLASDVTSSRGNDAKVIFAKVPAFMAALKLSSIVPDPSIMWAAFGDATVDRAPVQFGQFEADRRLDEWLGKLWLEEGGGGTGEESAELVAWYLANRTELDSLKRGVKGFAFFTTDEAPYPEVSANHVREHFGVEIPRNLATKSVFQKLARLYDPFVIFPRTSMEARKGGIDKEVAQRLERAGGRFKDVDLRATLIWHTRDDLDLYCKTPSGEVIHYARKRGQCSGELDVDRNVHGEDPKPVENIRWAEGTAPRGTYEFWVQLYGYHESRQGSEIPFELHLDNGGEISEVSGAVKGRGSTSNPQRVAFRGKTATDRPDLYAPYQERVILSKWEQYVPGAQILKINDPAAIIEVMLGAMALRRGTMDLETFVDNMSERKVSRAIQDDTRAALEDLAKIGVDHQVDASVFG